MVRLVGLVPRLLGESWWVAVAVVAVVDRLWGAVVLKASRTTVLARYWGRSDMARLYM